MPKLFASDCPLQQKVAYLCIRVTQSHELLSKTKQMGESCFCDRDGGPKIGLVGMEDHRDHFFLSVLIELSMKCAKGNMRTVAGWELKR